MAKLRASAYGILVICLLAGCRPSDDPPLGSAEPWRFAVVGDSRGDGFLDAVNQDAVATLAQAIAADGVELVLVPGDLVYGTPIGLEWQLQAWQESVAPLYRAGIRVYPIRGNHEAIAGITPWRSVWADLPQDGPAGEEGVTYSFVNRNALFIGLDQYVRVHRVNQGYLDSLLGDPQRPSHVFVFGHEPAFAAGHTTSLASYPEDRDAFWNSLGAAGAAMYFCGHDHFYGRASVTSASGWPVQQLIVGTGGAPASTFHGYVEPQVQPLFADSGHYGYVLVQVQGDTVDVQFKAQRAPGQPGVFTTVDQLRYTVPLPAQP